RGLDLDRRADTLGAVDGSRPRLRVAVILRKQQQILRCAQDDKRASLRMTKPQPLIAWIDSYTSSSVMSCAENTPAICGEAASSPMSRCCVPAYWACHAC